jgi:hypothetical protein
VEISTAANGRRFAVGAKNSGHPAVELPPAEANRFGGDSLIDLEADQPIGIKNIFLASL